MKVAVIVFSPSDNTDTVSNILVESLEKRQVEVEKIDITGDEEFFANENAAELFDKRIKEHDLICIGAPVYCHRFQYHVLDLIRALPKPGGRWGKYAVPFVTYGSVTSGIALEEAAKALRETGRLVPAGMKIAGSHCMSDPILGYEFNKGQPGAEALPVVEQLADRISVLGNGTPGTDASSSMAYQSFFFKLKTRIIFNEKTWHAKRYPNLVIDTKSCKVCGKCVKHCPVCHLVKTDSGIKVNKKSPCIHCLNCIKTCKTHSVSLAGNLERGKAFFSGLIKKHGNKEMPASAVYPIQ